MIITAIGFIAGILCTIAYIPQVIKSWQTRQTKDLSLPMFLLNVTSFSLWLIYGIALNQAPIVITNIFAVLISLSIVVLKIKHG